MPTPTGTQEGQNNVAQPLGWWAGGGARRQWSDRRGLWGQLWQAGTGKVLLLLPPWIVLLGHPTHPAPLQSTEKGSVDPRGPQDVDPQGQGPRL